MRNFSRVGIAIVSAGFGGGDTTGWTSASPRKREATASIARRNRR